MRCVESEPRFIADLHFFSRLCTDAAVAETALQQHLASHPGSDLTNDMLDDFLAKRGLFRDYCEIIGPKWLASFTSTVDEYSQHRIRGYLPNEDSSSGQQG